MAVRQRQASLPPLGRRRGIPAGDRPGQGSTAVRPSSVPAANRGLGAGLSTGSVKPPEGPLCRLDAVLFLDVDGVLHPMQVRHPRLQFQRSCMELLAEVVEKSGAAIVLSTAWRLDVGARRAVAEKLQEFGIPVFVSRTPSIAQFQRAREILAWVKKFRPITWVAVDDWPLLQENEILSGHFVQTDPRNGMRRDKADLILQLFQQQKEKVSRSLDREH